MKTFVTLAFLFMLVGVLAISAEAADWAMKADVPFAFQVGDTRMPAGLYEFSCYNSNGVLQIKSGNGEVVRFTIGSPLNASRAATPPKVTFNRYGNRYVLTGIVLAGGYSAQLPKSKPVADVELAAVR